jgi:hypothetical protein
MRHTMLLRGSRVLGEIYLLVQILKNHKLRHETFVNAIQKPKSKPVGTNGEKATHTASTCMPRLGNIFAGIDIVLKRLIGCTEKMSFCSR